jgi:Cdc6-like AAA superfamily ATPase
VDKCYEKGDVRTGIVLMRESGREAERQASKKIKVEHVMKSKASIVDEKANDLEERDRRVLELIKKNSGIETGRLVELVKEEGLEIPDSTLRRILQKLDKGGYIFREQVQTDSGGQTMKHFMDE